MTLRIHRTYRWEPIFPDGMASQVMINYSTKTHRLVQKDVLEEFVEQADGYWEWVEVPVFEGEKPPVPKGAVI